MPQNYAPAEVLSPPLPAQGSKKKRAGGSEQEAARAGRKQETAKGSIEHK